MVMFTPDVLSFDVRKINALLDGDCDWVWNESFHVGEFTATIEENVPRKLIRELRKLGIAFKKGKTLIVDDGDVIEVVDRKTKEPLFAALLK